MKIFLPHVKHVFQALFHRPTDIVQNRTVTRFYGLTTFLGSSCRNVIRIIWRSETLFSLLSRREFHKFSSKTQNPASEYQNLLRTVDLIYLIKKDKKKSIGVSWPVVFDSMQNNIYNLILILENVAVFCV